MALHPTRENSSITQIFVPAMPAGGMIPIPKNTNSMQSIPKLSDFELEKGEYNHVVPESLRAIAPFLDEAQGMLRYIFGLTIEIIL